MAPATAPVLIAYDGSEISKAGLRHAAELFPERPAVVCTVWEPGLATMTLTSPNALGGGMSPPPDPETAEAIDAAEREHAARVAQEGAELARSLGLTAEPHPVPDEVDVADTLLDLAREQGAAVVVVGSHGISGFRSRVMGSVARKLIQHSDRPVLVLRGG